MTDVPTSTLLPAGRPSTGRVTLTANDELAVAFTDNIGAVWLWSNGADWVWYTTDGTAPVADQSPCIPAGSTGWVRVATTNNPAGADQVRLLSPGTPVVIVQKG